MKLFGAGARLPESEPSANVASPSRRGGTVAPPALAAPSVASRAGAVSNTGTVPPPAYAPAATPAAARVNLSGEAPRLLLAIDATGSRAPAFQAAIRVTDSLLTVLPGRLEIALAVHGGGRVHTFTPFTRDMGRLRGVAAAISCKAGGTKLLDILERAAGDERVRVVVYIGDAFEESFAGAMSCAEALALNDTRLIILHDDPRGDKDTRAVFARMAAITRGAVLPFRASALDELAALLEAVSVLAVGGPEMLAEKQTTMPAAPLLLERIEDGKQLLIGRSGKR
jgi:hypothetical protein